MAKLEAGSLVGLGFGQSSLRPSFILLTNDILAVVFSQISLKHDEVFGLGLRIPHTSPHLSEPDTFPLSFNPRNAAHGV